jgi:hypothetical protein
VDGDRHPGGRRRDRFGNGKIAECRLRRIGKRGIGRVRGCSRGGLLGGTRIGRRTLLKFPSDKKEPMHSGMGRRKPHGQCLCVHSHMTKREQHGTDTNTGSHWPEHFQCKRSYCDESFGHCFPTRRSGIKTILFDDAFVLLAAHLPLFDSPRFFFIQSDLGYVWGMDKTPSAVCISVCRAEILEQNQGCYVLSGFVQGRRFLLVASTGVMRLRDASSLVLLSPANFFLEIALIIGL